MPLPALAETPDPLLPTASFFAGAYALVGAPGEGDAYRGGVLITALDDQTMQAERLTGGERRIEIGKIEKTRFDTPILRWYASGDVGGEHLGTCHFKVDLSNYPILTCFRAPDGDGPFGYEAMFPVDPGRKAQMEAFGLPVE